MLLCSYELQQNKGVVTETVKKRCQDTIDLWREHFRGKGSYMSTDTLEYYSQACRILGLGAEVSFCVTASVDGQPQPEVMTSRFANEEDLQIELKWRASDSIGKFCNKWY